METGISSGFLDQKAFPLINAMRSLYCVNHTICIVCELSAHDWNSEVKSALNCLKLTLLSNERRCKFSPSSGSLLSQSMQERGKMSPSNRKVRLQLSVYGTFWRKKMRSSWVFQFIFFSVRERAVFYKSCYLIGSDSGQYSPHPAHPQREVLFATIC